MIDTFRRRIDLLNADLKLQNDFDEAKSARKSKKKAYSRPRKKKSKVADSAFHFIAYVPVRDEVWELDGLEYRPLCLGIHTFVSKHSIWELALLTMLQRQVY